jgi:hypothetical protein
VESGGERTRQERRGARMDEGLQTKSVPVSTRPTSRASS